MTDEDLQHVDEVVVGKGFPTRVDGPGIHFEESMVGALATGKDRFALHLNVHIIDINVFLADPRHEARVGGTVECVALGGSFRIVDGVARLLVSSEGTRQRRMLYRLLAVGPNNQPITVVGCKKVHRRTLAGLWRDTTRMRVQIYCGTDDRPPVRTAVVRLSVVELIRMLRTFRATGPDRLQTIRRFLTFFASRLREVTR